MAILDIGQDLTNVDTNFPILAVGMYDFSVVEITSKDTESGNGSMLNIKLALDENATDIKGNPINVGFPVYDRIFFPKAGAMSKEGKPLDAASSIKRLAMFQDDIGKRTAKFDTELYIGCKLTAKVKIRHDSTDQYPDTNEIGQYVKKD